MKIHYWFCLFALVSWNQAFAASSTIIGKSIHARECYRMARTLSLSQYPEKSEEQNEEQFASTSSCDFALNEFLSSIDRASTLVNRGLIYARQQKFDLAFEDYKAAIAQNKRIKSTALINVGNAHFMQQDFLAASESYTRALELDVKEKHAATLNRGMAAEKLGKLKAAEQDYLKALEIIPNWDSALVRLERVRDKQRQANP